MTKMTSWDYFVKDLIFIIPYFEFLGLIDTLPVKKLILLRLAGVLLLNLVKAQIIMIMLVHFYLWLYT